MVNSDKVSLSFLKTNETLNCLSTGKPTFFYNAIKSMGIKFTFMENKKKCIYLQL